MDYVHRPRLLARLDRAMACPLTLVCAPAGYGKTTLLRQWQQDARHPTVWVTLDGRTSTRRQALLRLAGALNAVLPGPAGSAPVEDADQVVDLLNRAVANACDVAVVLDNHLPSPDLIALILGDVVDFLPPRLHVIVASRAVPDLALARLRMRAQLVEIGAADLAFTIEETSLLAARAVAHLHERSEGWAAGLRLLLDGGDAAPAAYLEREVFACQPEPVRRFLVQTCRLDVLSAPACNRASGRSDGQAMLEYLERANLFVIPLDAERRLYRYHKMLRWFLQTYGISPDG